MSEGKVSLRGTFSSREEYWAYRRAHPDEFRRSPESEASRSSKLRELGPQISKTLRAFYKTPEGVALRARLREVNVEATLRGLARRPTRPERSLFELLIRLFPGEWEHELQSPQALVLRLKEFCHE